MRLDGGLQRLADDPEAAALIANRYIDQFMLYLLESVSGRSEDAVEYLRVRADELRAEAKAAECADLGLRWHFIGHLQSNKARVIAPIAALVHTVDSPSLANELAPDAPAQTAISRPRLGFFGVEPGTARGARRIVDEHLARGVPGPVATATTLDGPARQLRKFIHG